jgi:multidrug resistance efflux pump
MKSGLLLLGRVSLTLAVLAVAGVLSAMLWDYYANAPWTRDGRVRADVVLIAPDVAGLISDVLVHDNQPVRRGDVLFDIDSARYRIAVEQAAAVVASRRAAQNRASLDLRRYDALNDMSVSAQRKEQAAADAAIAAAAFQQALADLHLAQLNLQRSEVRAAVDGTITNFSVQPGAYVSAGQGVAALVVSSSLRVEGYFEETKLPRIRPGDPVTVHLMGESRLLHGHVESIAAGTEDRERARGSDLLADVNPTFTWVRLAQRVPVRIALDPVPAGLQLVAGQTATVMVGSARQYLFRTIWRQARN